MKRKMTGNTPVPPASDIVIRPKLAAGDENTPRDVLEVMKDAVDAIKSLRERVRFLEKMESQRNNRRIGALASIVYEGDPAPESDLAFERPSERCQPNVNLNPQDHEGIDRQ